MKRAVTVRTDGPKVILLVRLRRLRETRQRLQMMNMDKIFRIDAINHTSVKSANHAIGPQ